MSMNVNNGGQTGSGDFREHMHDLFKDAGASRQDMHDIMQAARENGVSPSVIAKALKGGDSIETIKSDLQNIAEQKQDGSQDSDDSDLIG